MLFDLLEWFGQLRGFELILWSISIFFSLIFLLQTIISLFIGGDSGDLDDSADFGSQFFTLKNMVAFFTMFGWTGLAAYKAGFSNPAVIVIGLLAGLAMVFLMFFLMRQSKKLKHDGTLKMSNAINQVGETYLRIPAKRAGFGKVQVQVQGRYMELDAVTDDEEDIPTGRPIRVVSKLNDQVLIVTHKLAAETVASS